MKLYTRIGLTTSALALMASIFTTGCTPPAVHPNQINVFDGATYDTLTLAHGALTSLRASVARDFSSYTPTFNKTAEAYNQAVAAYGLYRNSQEDASVTNSIHNLTLAIVLLETSIQADLHVESKKNGSLRRQALQIRSRAAQAHVSVSDILTELEIAAAVAQTVPSAQPYSALAKVVIEATSGALNEEQAVSGKPIDLQTIPVIALIN